MYTTTIHPEHRKQIDPCERRLSNLALELTLAGGQVLKEHFDFDHNQVNEWLDKTIFRAQENRRSDEK